MRTTGSSDTFWMFWMSDHSGENPEDKEVYLPLADEDFCWMDRLKEELKKTLPEGLLDL